MTWAEIKAEGRKILTMEDRDEAARLFVHLMREERKAWGVPDPEPQLDFSRALSA